MALTSIEVPVAGDGASNRESDVEELTAIFTDAVARLYRRLRAERGGDPMGDSHRSVLKVLVGEGPRTLRELSDHEHVKPPSMNQTVNWLEEAGLLARTGDPSDGRKVIIAATAKGVALIEETRRRRNEWLNLQLEALTDEERRVLAAASTIIVRITDS
ncbi:MAG: MarR family winged helix-turn-helix transcriptional regulator [Acidimicrobiales bacterium]